MMRLLKRASLFSIVITFFCLQYAPFVAAASPPAQCNNTSGMSCAQQQLFNENINYFDAADCGTAAASPSPGAGNGVAFDDSQSSDTGNQTTVDDDGVDPSPTNSPDHQSSTSYADGQLGALHTNYIALNPGWASANGLVLGDVAALTYNGKTIYAVYGDNHVGNTPHAEISVQADMALKGITDPTKADNLTGVHFVVYPNTHQRLGGSVDQTQIDQIGAAASGGGTISGGGGASPGTGSGTFASLTGDAKISGTFILGFDASTPKSTIESVFSKYKAGGIFLTGTTDAAAAGFDKSFFDKLSQDAGHQIVAASDEEGGLIHRYSYGFNFPSPHDISTMSDSAVQSLGQKVGQAMAANGINTDLAPVLDVSTDSSGTDTGVAGRSFSNDPDVVASKAGAFAAGLKSAGVNPVYKHFPGLGSSPGNTDTGSVTSPSLSQLESKDLKPYSAIDNKNGAAVMLDNAHVPGLTGPGEVASTSSAAVSLLQGKYNFSGLIMTDDLTASGVPKALPNAVTDALKAGVDMPLFTYRGDSQLDSAVSAAKSGGVDTSSSLKKIDDFVGAGAAGSGSSTPAGNQCCQSGGSTQLVGNTPAEQVWNYFIGKGLSNTLVAGIMGNLEIESGFDPTIVNGGGHSNDPSSVSVAWGLAQWDPGSKILGIQQQSGVSGNIDDLATQLDIVWWEASTDNSPSGGWSFSSFKALTSVDDATTYWQDHFEGAPGQGDQARLNSAHKWLGYVSGAGVSGPGTPAPSSPSTGCSGGSGSTPSGGLTNPFPDGWTPGRLDMGYDGHFTKEIVSPCEGTVEDTYTQSGPGSWEGYYMAVKCSASISGLPTQTFYFSEGINPTIKSGSVKAGQEIAIPGPTGFSEGPGGIEWGLATDDNPRLTYAANLGGSHTCSPTPASKAMVLSFYQWATTTLHVPGPTNDESCAGAP